MNVVADNHPAIVVREFNNAVIRVDAVTKYSMRKYFNFTIAKNIRYEMLDDLVEWREGWGHGSTFVLTDDEI